MCAQARSAADPLVTGAEIARMAGVTRAAVSNWRRRHDDFPAPAGGGPSSPLFRLAEVRAWLDRERKGRRTSGEAELWQLLRGVYGDDLVHGLAAVARQLTDGRPAPGLSADLARRTAEVAAAGSPAELVDRLAERFADATRRSGSDQVTSARIVAAVRHFTGDVAKDATILDPACGVGTLLLSVGPAAGPVRHGQEIDPATAEFARLRAGLTGRTGTGIRTGDALREDRWPRLEADLVVCDPPVAVSDWGRPDLLLDARWELGVPSRAESELAWLQHAYAHTAPGGRAVLVLPASVAYRKAGRRIRAELVRRGILTQVVALPPGMAGGHALPVHLWFLRRPVGAGASFVRMVDLTGNSPDDALDPDPWQVADVPLIDLLDDTVDLTPATRLTGAERDYAAEYTALRAALAAGLDALRTALPSLGAGAGTRDRASVGVADLARAGLMEFADGVPVSTSDLLDTDYLHGFLLGPANRRRSATGSGVTRLDARGARVPRMDIGEQRRYGCAFRALQELEDRVREVADLAARTAALAREGLTNGALGPPARGDALDPVTREAALSPPARGDALDPVTRDGALGHVAQDEAATAGS